jgi:hypothetical protein
VILQSKDIDISKMFQNYDVDGKKSILDPLEILSKYYELAKEKLQTKNEVDYSNNDINIKVSNALKRKGYDSKIDVANRIEIEKLIVEIITKKKETSVKRLNTKEKEIYDKVEKLLLIYIDSDKPTIVKKTFVSEASLSSRIDRIYNIAIR